MIEDYEDAVRRKLTQSLKADASVFLEVLFRPSFHPETLLRAERGASSSRLHFRSFTTNLWYSEPDNRPEVVEAEFALGTEVARDFWAQLAGLGPQAISPEEVLGLDGMSVEVAYAGGDEPYQFEVWLPRLNSREGRVVKLLYDLFWSCERPTVVTDRLEQLHGYLHYGLPVRKIEGDPVTLRFFASLSYDQETVAELQHLFSSLADQKAVIVDMTNFDGMGTAYYPVFREFIAADSELAWVAKDNSRALQQAEEMEVEADRIFDSVSQARNWFLSDRSNG
ncbi:MAG: hypothetical protein AAF532_00135 [Planctomycetota bacterium]